MWNIINNYYSRWPYSWRKKIKPNIQSGIDQNKQQKAPSMPKEQSAPKPEKTNSTNNNEKAKNSEPRGSKTHTQTDSSSKPKGKGNKNNRPLVWKFPEK